MRTPEREAAYEAIDTERDYQGTLSSAKLEVGEEMTLLQEYLERARRTWTDDFTPSEEATQHFIRKIAGIAVRCLENHGAPHRK